LRDDAVETDDAPAQMRESRVPDRKPVAATAIRRRDDVESQKAERRAVTDDRYRRDRLVIDETDEKAVRIGGVEARGVVQPRVPAFGGRPVDREVDLGPCHRADSESLRFTVRRHRRWHVPVLLRADEVIR
jgi:hypothetical protein